jgi:hypothetical protein
MVKKGMDGANEGKAGAQRTKKIQTKPIVTNFFRGRLIPEN